MASEWDDEELARAIARSLEETSAGSRDAPISIEDETIVIDDGSDTESESSSDVNAQLKRVLDLSKADVTVKAEPKPPAPSTSSSTPAEASSSKAEANAPLPPPTAGPLSFMAERAKLEQARLERLKRLRPETDQPDPAVKRARSSPPSSDTEDDDATELTRPVKPLPAASKGKEKAAKPEDEIFWNGELRQTANSLADPSKDKRSVFRLSEIIGPKKDVAFALLASYSIDWPWIYQMFDPVTPVVCVAQPDQSGNESIKEVLPNWIKTTPFLRLGRGCMHMKFMLLFYKSGRLRVVINTANFMTYDWKEIENSSWVQDVPQRPQPLPSDKNATDFGSQFERVLRSLNVETALRTFRMNGHDLPLSTINSLRSGWDFSKVKARLVASIAGKHEGWPDVIRTGHPALMKAVRDVGCTARPGQALSAECQGSSIGTYSTMWTNEFICSCRGESAETWLDVPKSRRQKLSHPSGLKIVFPSLQTVRDSRLGERGGGTIFCRRSQWEGTRLPRELFHDSRSKRGGVLMHSKMIIATLGKQNDVLAKARAGGRRKNGFDSDDDSDEITEVIPPQPYGWAYVGSHNFTPSAWGTLSGSAFNPTLNITNYEIGVVLPLVDQQHADNVACWNRPPRKYDLKTDVPWMQEESAELAGSQGRSDD